MERRQQTISERRLVRLAHTHNWVSLTVDKSCDSRDSRGCERDETFVFLWFPRDRRSLRLNLLVGGELQNNIRKWLSPPNPSINHNTAVGVHHKVTATWFTSGAVYAGWNALGSLLWVHGKRMFL